MDTLVSYDPDELETDVLRLSLAEASRKYKNWDRHENGALIFGVLTVAIAMRQLVIERIGKQIKFDSQQAVYDAFNELR